MATLAVVFLHTNSALSSNAIQFGLTEDQIKSSTIYYLCMTWSVPIFMMITGALLLNPDKKITWGSCIKKYVKRILLTLLVFGIPFSILEIVFNTKNISVVYFFDAMLNVLNGKSWDYLWYLYALIGLYLFLPILKAFIDNSNFKSLFYLICVIFVFDFLLKNIDRIFGTTIAFEIPLSGFIVFYALVGELIVSKREYLLKYKKAILILTIIEGLSLIFISLYIYPNCTTFIIYDSSFVAIFSITIFSLFMNFDLKNKDLIWKLDRLCFGVYLIHPVFINLFYKFFKLTPANFGNLYLAFIVLFWLFFACCSFLGSWIMNQIPILRKYIL